MAAQQDELTVVMSAWKLKPGLWQTVGHVPALSGELRPVIEIAGARYVVRRQPPDLTENDTRFRHAFMRHLRDAGLPVPALLPQSDGITYAVVENGIYELQTWLDGQPYLSDGPASDLRLAAAAATLGRLHQASAAFQWQPHAWPEERSAAAIARTYVDLIRAASRRTEMGGAIATALDRVAGECAERITAAADALAARPGPPELHIHGDYQAHNLTFNAQGVGAIYDFDAARWARRLDEVAYALLYFAAVRWDDPSALTPPLVPDGLDILRAQSFLTAYGDEAPPADGEAELLGDALALALPIVFANGVAEDLIFPQDFDETANEDDALERVSWADSFGTWLDRYHDTLGQAWVAGHTP